MDPLSITASIVNVLQAANAVISICYDFRATINGCPWGLNRVLEEIKDLRNVLESLENLAANAKTQKDGILNTQLPTIKLLCQSDQGPLDLCLKTLNILSQKLVPPSWSRQTSSKTRAFIQAVGWTLTEADVRRSLEDLERCKSTLNLAIG